MSFTQRTYEDEILVEAPKYKITLSNDTIMDDKASIELNVDATLEGTPLNASTMNDLENRISNAIKGLVSDIASMDSSLRTTINNNYTTLNNRITQVSNTVNELINTTISGVICVKRTANIPNTGWTNAGGYYTRVTGIELPAGMDGSCIDLYVPRASLATLTDWVSVDNVNGTIYISSPSVPNNSISIVLTFKQTRT